MEYATGDVRRHHRFYTPTGDIVIRVRLNAQNIVLISDRVQSGGKGYFQGSSTFPKDAFRHFQGHVGGSESGRRRNKTEFISSYW